MKNARPGKTESSATANGVSIIGGALPTRKNTVTADVLSRLLGGARLTSIAGVFDSSTTRLGDVVHRLERDYGWRIDREPKAQGCKDGRVSWVSEYWISAEALAAARRRGADEWCAGVRSARAKLRRKAAEAARMAERFNQARRQTSNPNQSDLFGGQDGGANGPL